MMPQLGRQRVKRNLRGHVQFALNAGFLKIFAGILADVGGEVFEHVKAVTLRLEQVAVRARPGIRLATKAPGDVHDVAQQAISNGTTRLLHGARVPVVEVDREEELLLFGLGDQLLGLIEVEHQWFLDQQRHTTSN